jgi:uncharacterized heparinase superfamily protein
MFNVLRWAYTIRYLRPVQIYGRVCFWLRRPVIDLSPAPSVRVPSNKLFLSIRRERSFLHPWVFRFLNEEHGIADADSWDSPLISKLWRYNLHYFDDLMAEGAKTRSQWHQELILRWINENPPGRGTGWEPYPTALRMVNWIRWALAGNDLLPEFRQSLAVQARLLSGRLEYHLLGNHLWANAKALVFAGAYFEGSEADRWRTTGLKLLRDELKEQILADGGHFERSPMYHAIILADLLDLIQLASSYHDALPAEDVAAWRDVIPRMIYWLSVMTHPDGDIAQFNDAAFGIAPRLAELEALAKKLDIAFDTRLTGSLHDLPESGYVRLQKGPAVLLADVGNIGPDYLPGHAHADTLSFEMSLHGQRVIVDTGTSRYNVSDERLLQRGTQAHNTVQIDGEDSSEVWGSFRVARRARPMDRVIRQEHGALMLDCAHNGYERLCGRPVHQRHWSLNNERLIVRDSIKGSFTTAVSRFHFHPDMEAMEGVSCKTGKLSLPGGAEVKWQVKGGRQNMAASTYHPEFGLCIPNHCLEVAWEGNAVEVEFIWQ